MLRTDTDNFNRFLTSLGLLLLGAALVIPYFFFGNSSTLSIPAAELRGMTEAGRTALEGRQEGIIALEPWVIFGASLLGALGVVLVVLGGLRLRSAQRSDDEEAELRRMRARLEVERMSPAERDERAAEKVVVEDIPVESQRAEARAAASGGDSKPSPSEVRLVRALQIKRVLRRIEEVFGEQAFDPYVFNAQVRIGSATGNVRMDGLFEAVDRRPDVLLQVLVPPDPGILKKVARLRADELIATLGRYEAVTGRRASGWMVIVMPEDEPANAHDEYRQAIDRLRNSLKPFGSVVSVDEKELERLPAMFSKRFRSF